jgi:hypothetical protein
MSLNGRYANIDNSHDSQFGSTDNSRSLGISGIINNGVAANVSRYNGGCWFKKRRMTKRRKMNRRSKKRKIYRGGSCSSCGIKQIGGLHSVTNFNNGFSTGGILSANNLGEANPVPYQPRANFPNPYFPNQKLSY